jgi:V/A-type H+-transporting ATPase subunit E
MNGIEKITARILAEASAEAEAILAAARAQAEEIGADYEKKAQEEYQSCMRAGALNTQQRVQRMGNTARLEAKKEILALKQELIAEAYTKAREMILNLPQEEYVAFLAAQAGKAAISGDEEIVLNAADRAKVGEQVVAAANALVKERGLEPKLVLAEATAAVSGGLLLRKGAVEVNCGLDSLVEMSRNSLDAEIAAVLFA